MEKTHGAQERVGFGMIRLRSNRAAQKAHRAAHGPFFFSSERQMKYIPRGMQMTVRPHSIWLAYELANRREIANLLPTGYYLADDIRILKDDPLYSSPKLLFNAYSIESPFMHGNRLEILTLAKNKQGEVSFVVLDVLSNTLKWDPFSGIKWADAQSSTRVKDRRVVHFTRSGKRLLRLTGQMRRNAGIQSRFAIDANRRCFYRNSTLSIAMDFNTDAVMEDVTRVFPIDIQNTLWTEQRGRLTHCFVHTKPMTFVINGVEE